MCLYLRIYIYQVVYIQFLHFLGEKREKLNIKLPGALLEHFLSHQIILNVI